MTSRLFRSRRVALGLFFLAGTILWLGFPTSTKEGKPARARDRKPGRLSGYISALNDEPLKLSCKSCALVSSSGRVLGQKKGSEIDEADCMFRMNATPTKGFEIDVGHKTTVRVLSYFSVPVSLLHATQDLKFIIAWGSDEDLGKTTSKYKELVMTTKRYRIG